jgi:O-methyltransferase
MDKPRTFAVQQGFLRRCAGALRRRIEAHVIIPSIMPAMLRRHPYWAFRSSLVDDFVNGPYGDEYGISRLQKLALIRQFDTINERIVSATGTLTQVVLARAILSIPRSAKGDVVECGCYKGASTASLSLVCRLTDRRLVACDSFEGLPDDDQPVHVGAHSGIYGYLRRGMFCGRFDEVAENVAKFGALETCDFVSGFFNESLKGLERPIAFSFLDVDLASSTRDAIKHIWPLLIENGLIYSDDAGDLDVVRVFWDERWWEETLGCRAPGFIGSGCGIPIVLPFSSIGYTEKITGIDLTKYRRAPHLWYPDAEKLGSDAKDCRVED